MTNPDYERPVVLCISGHDPIGGAGVQADIETLAALGCHAATAITCLTVQNTRDVARLDTVAPGLLMDQITAICDDLSVMCVKIGLIGSTTLAAVIAAALTEIHAPVVLDPVLAASGGKDFATLGLVQAIAGLLPQVDLVTPNRDEARRLSGQSEAATAAQSLIDTGGARAVLLTGADEANEHRVRNYLYQAGMPTETFQWALLPGQYHGSGCTLAAACAAYLARGETIKNAAAEAQEFTWQALSHAQRPGHGQAIPTRNWT